MAVIIKTDDQHDWQVNPNKSGEGYDTCPACDREQEHQYKFGGNDGHADYHFWDMYSCDQLAGGCGATWTRTTPQGMERDYKKGLNSKWGTQSAATGRTFHSGLAADDWERVFGH